MSSRIARKLRSTPTAAEARAWSRLRRRQIAGHRFRRQVPLGRYVVDFVCFDSRLIVEIDGGQHSNQAKRDATRTVWLEAQGFKVLRFWNNDVLGKTDSVIEVIRVALASASDPPP